MSSRPVQLELPTGETIWARVSVDGPQNVSSDGFKHLLDVEDLSRTVRGISVNLREAVSGLAPDEVEVEFGLELALKSGKLISMLAEAGTTASVKITLAWRETESASPSGTGTAATET